MNRVRRRNKTSEAEQTSEGLSVASLSICGDGGSNSGTATSYQGIDRLVERVLAGVRLYYTSHRCDDLGRFTASAIVQRMSDEA